MHGVVALRYLQTQLIQPVLTDQEASIGGLGNGHINAGHIQNVAFQRQQVGLDLRILFQEGQKVGNTVRVLQQVHGNAVLIGLVGGVVVTHVVGGIHYGSQHGGLSIEHGQRGGLLSQWFKHGPVKVLVTSHRTVGNFFCRFLHRALYRRRFLDGGNLCGFLGCFRGGSDRFGSTGCGGFHAGSGGSAAGKQAKGHSDGQQQANPFTILFHCCYLPFYRNLIQSHFTGKRDPEQMLKNYKP